MTLSPLREQSKRAALYINDKGEVCLEGNGRRSQNCPPRRPANRKKAEIATAYVKILDQVRTLLRAQKTETDAGSSRQAQVKLKK